MVLLRQNVVPNTSMANIVPQIWSLLWHYSEVPLYYSAAPLYKPNLISSNNKNLRTLWDNSTNGFEIVESQKSVVCQLKIVTILIMSGRWMSRRWICHPTTLPWWEGSKWKYENFCWWLLPCVQPTLVNLLMKQIVWLLARFESGSTWDVTSSPSTPLPLQNPFPSKTLLAWIWHYLHAM